MGFVVVFVIFLSDTEMYVSVAKVTSCPDSLYMIASGKYISNE
jgi:hypothetical protein